jgi:hypothetical protein
MRKKKNITLSLIIFSLAIIGAINVIGSILNSMYVCSGRFEGDPAAKCVSLR